MGRTVSSLVASRASRLVASGRVFAEARSTVTSYDCQGQPCGYTWGAVFLDQQDPQKPLGYCGHSHRSAKSAERCGQKLLLARITQALETGQLA